MDPLPSPGRMSWRMRRGSTLTSTLNRNHILVSGKSLNGRLNGEFSPVPEQAQDNDPNSRSSYATLSGRRRYMRKSFQGPASIDMDVDVHAEAEMEGATEETKAVKPVKPVLSSIMTRRKRCQLIEENSKPKPCSVLIEPLQTDVIEPILLRKFINAQNLFNYCSNDDFGGWRLDQDFWTKESNSDSPGENSTNYYIQLHDDRIIELGAPVTFYEQKQRDTDDIDLDFDFDLEQDLDLDSNSNLNSSPLIESHESRPLLRRKNIKVIKSKIIHSSNPTVTLEMRDVNPFTRDLQDLLAFTKDYITRFSFGRRLFSHRLIRENIFLDLISNSLPNLKYLAVSTDMLDSWDDSSTCSKFPTSILAQLNTVRFQNHGHHNKNKSKKSFTSTFILGILRVAPNLRKIYGLPAQHVQTVEKNGNSPAIIKSISGLYTDHSNKVNATVRGQNNDDEGDTNDTTFDAESSLPSPFFETMRALSRMKQLRLEILDLRGLSNSSEEEERAFENSSGGKTLTSIYMDLLLQSNFGCGHLVKLKIRPLGSKLVNVRCPALETLTHLHLTFEGQGDDLGTKIFPAGWDLERIFTNLTFVEIKFDWRNATPGVMTKAMYRQNIISLFPGEGNVSSSFAPSIFHNVRHLQLTNTLMTGQLLKLSLIFRNIGHLTFKSSSKVLKRRLPLIFSYWPKLKSLHIQIDLADRHCCLDSAFLGISDASLKRLEQQGYPPLGELQEGQVRVNPSICQLLELENLKISFYHFGSIFGDTFLNANLEPLLTYSLAAYGASKEIMPNLEVRIGFDDSCNTDEINSVLTMLKPLANHVTIET